MQQSCLLFNASLRQVFNTLTEKEVFLPKLPKPRGKLISDRDMSSLTWLRVGGRADYFFQPADKQDLQEFLSALSLEISIFPMGVGSNLIVRDGGLRAVVIRLGRFFNHILIEGNRVTAGAAALDAHVAKKAADSGLDLTFLRTIPGSIGGALRMNAGCYGSYVADYFTSARLIKRTGEEVTLFKDDLVFGYRQSNIPEGAVITEVVFEANYGDPKALHQRMDGQIQKRDETQPVKELSAGSTFQNPSGFSSTGRADDVHDFKAWKLIDDAGLRGARLGGAQMSEKHPNFLINADNATAADLEGLGELIRKRVFKHSQIELVWEIMRVGEPVT